MNRPYIEANIQETDDGPFYPVRLWAVPRVGELINLHSFLDQNSGHTATHYYEVVKVIHRLHDVIEGDQHAGSGHQSVVLFVRPSTDSIFKA
ncbi:MAG TPA: hypothetical protein VGB53_16920 [Rubricoccaceae bacterium]|jgi:hypothetical protein